MWVGSLSGTILQGFRIELNIFLKKFYGGGSDMKQNELEQMLQTVSQRLGTTPEQLKQSAQNGNLAEVIGGMDPADARNLQRVLSDQQAAQTILNSPQAQELLKKLNLQ